MILSVGGKTSALCGVVPVKLEVRQYACRTLLVENGEQELDALVEISRHPVGGGEVYPLALALAETVDSAVLEETSDNGADLDILADSGDAGAQTAYASDDA